MTSSIVNIIYQGVSFFLTHHIPNIIGQTREFFADAGFAKSKPKNGETGWMIKYSSPANNMPTSFILFKQPQFFITFILAPPFSPPQDARRSAGRVV